MADKAIIADDRPLLVTVVIPVYNRLSFLGTTIRGVLEQSFQDWELIVVDDGSQEDVGLFLSRYQDPRIHYFRQANQGNGAARNFGIRQGKGEFVICLDSDDVWHPDFLFQCVNYLIDHPETDLVYSQVRRIDADGNLLPDPISPHPVNGDILAELLFGYPILPSSALIRRRCFERWGYYTSGQDDWGLWLRWAARGCRFYCLERPLLNYRVHSWNLNKQWDQRRAVHFAMLDTFYALDQLPEKALALRDRAYANQHCRFAKSAFWLGRKTDCLDEFILAAIRLPELLSDPKFYIQIIDTHQDRVGGEAQRSFDVDAAEAVITSVLSSIFESPVLSDEINRRKKRTYGLVYFILARLTYSLLHDSGRARLFLWRAVRSYPSIAWQDDNAIWFLRLMVGYKWIQAMKTLCPGQD